MNHLEALNIAAFLRINADLQTPHWKISVAAFVADYLIYLIPLIVIAMWCWGKGLQRRLAVKACLVALVALGVNQIIVALWPHPRPFMVSMGHSFMAHASDSSFPSDHATVFAAIGLTLVFNSVRSMIGWSILALGVIVAWSRIFLGVHFPLDMAGAVAVVCLAWAAVHLAWGRVGNAIVSRIEQIYRFALAQPISQGWIGR
jgi:undecaprenyl-diphosphatase